MPDRLHLFNLVQNSVTHSPSSVISDPKYANISICSVAHSEWVSGTSSSEETDRAIVREGGPEGRISETAGEGFVKQVGFKPEVKERSYGWADWWIKRGKSDFIRDGVTLGIVTVGIHRRLSVWCLRHCRANTLRRRTVKPSSHRRTELKWTSQLNWVEMSSAKCSWRR